MVGFNLVMLLAVGISPLSKMGSVSTGLSKGSQNPSVQDTILQTMGDESTQQLQWDRLWALTGGYLQDLEVEPIQSPDIYATNGYQIFRSTTGGDSWYMLDLGLPAPLDMIVPFDDVILYYSRSSGLMLSTNGGENFNPVAQGTVLSGYMAAAFSKPMYDGSLYLACLVDTAFSGTNSRITLFKSNGLNYGDWQDMGSFYLPNGENSFPAPYCVWAEDSVILVGIGGYKDLAASYDSLVIMGTVDTGLSWAPFLSSGIPGNVYDIERVQISGPPSYSYFFAATSPGIFYDTCMVITTLDFHLFHDLSGAADIFPLESDSSGEVQMLIGAAGQEGGVHYAEVSGPIFQDTTLYDAEGIRKMAITIQGINMNIICASEGLGVVMGDTTGVNWFLSNDSLVAWSTLAGHALWSQGQRMYTVDLSGRVQRSTDAGRSWQILGLNPWIMGTSVAASPNNPYVVYVSALYTEPTLGVIARSTDGGNNWSYQGGLGANFAIPVLMRVNPSNEDVLWALRYSSNSEVTASMSTDAGSSWTDFPGIVSPTCLESSPSGTVFWGTEANGIVFGDAPPFDNRIDSLNGKGILGMAWSKTSKSLIVAAVEGTKAELWMGDPDDQASWQKRTDLPNNVTGMFGASDEFGNVVLLLQESGYNRLILNSTDGGYTWHQQILPNQFNCVAIADTGRAFMGTMGEGFFWTSLMGAPPTMQVVADPNSLNLGDTGRVFVIFDEWIPETPVCSLRTLAGETMEIPLSRDNPYETQFKGEYYTAGLSEGPAVIKATASDRFGRPLAAQDSVQISEGSGEFMPLDSVYVYPNPAPSSDYPNSIYFKVFTNTQAEVSVALYDIEGKLAGYTTATVAGYDDRAAVELDISQIPSGIYIWSLVARATNDPELFAQKTGKLAITW